MNHIFMDMHSISRNFIYGFLTASALSGMYIYNFFYNVTGIETVVPGCRAMQMKTDVMISPYVNSDRSPVENIRFVKRHERSDWSEIHVSDQILYRPAKHKNTRENHIYHIFSDHEVPGYSLNRSRVIL